MDAPLNVTWSILALKPAGEPKLVLGTREISRQCKQEGFSSLSRTTAVPRTTIAVGDKHQT